MQVLVVVTLSDNTHRTCQWVTDQVTSLDKDNVSHFVREVIRDAKERHAKAQKVFIFLGGTEILYEGESAIAFMLEGDVRIS